MQAAYKALLEQIQATPATEAALAGAQSPEANAGLSPKPQSHVSRPAPSPQQGPISAPAESSANPPPPILPSMPAGSSAAAITALPAGQRPHMAQHQPQPVMLPQQQTQSQPRPATPMSWVMASNAAASQHVSLPMRPQSLATPSLQPSSAMSALAPQLQWPASQPGMPRGIQLPTRLIRPGIYVPSSGQPSRPSPISLPLGMSPWGNVTPHTSSALSAPGAAPQQQFRGGLQQRPHIAHSQPPVPPQIYLAQPQSRPMHPGSGGAAASIPLPAGLVSQSAQTMASQPSQSASQLGAPQSGPLAWMPGPQDWQRVRNSLQQQLPNVRRLTWHGASAFSLCLLCNTLAMLIVCRC